MKPITILLILFFLVGCSSVVNVIDGAQPGDVLLQESFSDLSGGWQTSSTVIGEQGYYNGVYRIMVNIQNYDLWAVAQTTYRDVHLEVEAARYGGSEENRFGLVCRYQDPTNFYFFIISSDGYYAIGKVSDGVTSLLGQPMMAQSHVIITGMAPNTLRFDCIASTLTGYVNGQMIAVTQDSSYRKGKVGLIAGTFGAPGVEIVFDNFAVIQP